MLATGLGVIFGVLGALKVSGQPPALHAFQHQEYMRHYQPLGLDTPAARVSIGAWELACASLLLFGGSGTPRTLGLAGLVCAMSGAAACHLAFDPKDNLAGATPALVLLALSVTALLRGGGGSGGAKPKKTL